MRFAKLVESIGEHALKSVLTLIAFIPILLTLGESVIIPWIVATPGNLFTLAVGMSVGGLVLSYFVGIRLPGLEYNNQRAEAAFRKDLVYGEDDKPAIDLMTMDTLFADVKANYSRLFMHYTYFDLWRNSYYQLSIILPYIVMGPSLFAGVITLGTISQTSNAFNKVHQSASFLLDRWPDVMELFSVRKRLKEFEERLDD